METRKYVAEFIGSMLLIMVGIGTIMFGSSLAFRNLGRMEVCIAFGAIVLALVYAIGNISGCHINPAVTIGVLAIKGIKAVDAAIYIIMQLLGGLTGAAVVFYVFTSQYGSSASAVGSFGSIFFNYESAGISGYDVGPVFIIEIMLAFILQLVILGSMGNKRWEAVAGIAIGLTITSLILFAGGIDGAGINPMRAISTATFASLYQSAYMTIALVVSLANIVGALLGSLLYKWMADTTKEQPGTT